MVHWSLLSLAVAIGDVLRCQCCVGKLFNCVLFNTFSLVSVIILCCQLWLYSLCVFWRQPSSTTGDDSLSTVTASVSDDGQTSGSNAGRGVGLHHLGQVDKAGDPSPVSGWLKSPAVQSTKQRAAVESTPPAGGREEGRPKSTPRAGGREEGRPTSTLSQPFGDYSRDSLEG